MPLSKKVQEIVNLITADRQALLASIEGLSQSQLKYTAADGRWSIEDILHHLALTDEANGKLMGGMLKKAESLNLGPDPSPDLVRSFTRWTSLRKRSRPGLRRPTSSRRALTSRRKNRSRALRPRAKN